jgi:hypothetical protein
MGAMGLFVGPYGHVWEAGLRLKGTQIDEKLLAQRAQSRLLWRALLKGDFVYGKLLYDEGHAERVAAQSPTDAASIVCLLSLGGDSGAAQRLVATLGDKRKGNAAITGREMALMRAVGEAMEGRGEVSVQALHGLAAESARAPALRQVAMAALYHVYRSRKQNDAARRTADALWAEAETARQQLEAMGVRPLAREAALPATIGAREETAASSRKATLAR